MASIAEPILIYTKDIPVQIQAVIAIRAVDITDDDVGTPGFNPLVAWEKGSDKAGPFIRITDLSGLSPSRKYKLTFLLAA